MTIHQATPKDRSKSVAFTCVESAGLGVRDASNCTCRECNRDPGREALRAIFDDKGRWLVHWREKDGEEWVGTYRLLPC